LTGAGWGGCTVSLVPEDKVEQFIKDVSEKYYFKKFPDLKNNAKALEDTIFSSRPSMGAAIFEGNFE
jgi:galactokinase